MPDRRDFIKKLSIAAMGFFILPPATTYGRVWRVRKTTREFCFYDPSKFAGDWKFIISGVHIIAQSETYPPMISDGSNLTWRMLEPAKPAKAYA